MHRSSESVAAIATALAKAQIELSIPKRRWWARSTTIAQTVRKVSASLVVERPRHCAQDLRRPTDRGRANDRH
jgi:hypothetical protein